MSCVYTAGVEVALHGHLSADQIAAASLQACCDVLAKLHIVSSAALLQRPQWLGALIAASA
jgi:hypothetical protein